jgi:hypothetical protein
MTLKEENAILLESLSKMIDVVLWMSGSNDFSPEGQAFEGWKKAQSDIDNAHKLVDSYKKKEDNYYEETANAEGAKDTDVMPEETSPDIIPGTDVMIREYREPQVDNSAIENHETAGMDNATSNTPNISAPSTEVKI